MGLDLPPFNAPRWDLRLNADWQIVDASAAVLALPNTFLSVNEFNAGAGFGLVRTSTFDALGNLLLSGSSITLTGSNGFITSASSITASAFFGDASHLSNLPSGPMGAVNTAQFNAGGNFFFGGDQIRYDTTSGGLKIGDPASAIPTGAISSMTVQSNQALTVAFLSHQEGGPVTLMLGCDVNCGTTHHNPGALRHNYVRGYDTALEGSVNSNIQEAMIYRKGFPTAVNLSFMPQGGADDSPVSIGPLTYNIVFGGSGTFFESPVAFGGYGGGTYYGANPDAFDTYGIARFHNVISLSHLNADPSYFQSYSSMTLTNSTMTLTGQYGTVTSASSITASGFFGDGSQLSNIPTVSQVNFNTSQLTLLAASTTTLSASTAAIASVVGALGVSTNTLSVSTASLQSQINAHSTILTAVGVSTNSLQSQINSINTSTATIFSILNTVGISTASLSVSTQTLSVSTAALNSAKVNRVGDTMTGGLTMSASSITLTGSSGFITGGSSVTASAFFGDLSHATGFVIMASSSSTNSITPLATFIGVSTVTVTLRGGRPYEGFAELTYNNSTSLADVSVKITENGTNISNTYVTTLSANFHGTIPVHFTGTSSPSGSNTYTLWVLGSLVGGVPTVTNRIIVIKEY